MSFDFINCISTPSVCRRILLAVGLLLPVFLTSACKSDYPVSARNNPGGENREPRQVKIARVSEIPMEQTVTVTGTLAAYDQAAVSAKVPGRMKSIAVDLGSVVRAGQIIAQIEQQDYKLRLQQAEAALAQARARVGLSPEGKDDRIEIERTGTVRQAQAVLDEAKLKLSRAENLVQRGVMSKADHDAAEAEHKVALSRYQDAVEEIRNRQALVVQRRSELEIARQQLADSSIYAPFDGVVQEKRASIGEYLAAGAPVVNVVRMDPLRLRAEVPERESRSVRAGLLVRVTVEGDTKRILGQDRANKPNDHRSESRVDSRSRSTTTAASFVPGHTPERKSSLMPATRLIAVPVSAVISFAGIDKVILVQEGKAVEKPITLGRRTSDWVEVLQGLTTADSVVINPGNLQSGQPLVVTE